jgi:hypothetical protein
VGRDAALTESLFSGNINEPNYTWRNQMVGFTREHHITVLYGQKTLPMDDTPNLNHANPELYVEETRARKEDNDPSKNKMRKFSRTKKFNYMQRIAAIVRSGPSEGLTVHGVADVIDAEDGPKIEADNPDERAGSRARGYRHHQVYKEIHSFKMIELYPMGILWVKGTSKNAYTLKDFKDVTADERLEALNAWEKYQANKTMPKTKH